MQAIGTNLRRLRVRAGLTQDALAGMLHVTRQTVSSWEIGRTEPDLDTLLALAEALHCDATELIYGVKRNGYQQYQRRWIVCSMVCGVLVTLLVSLLVLVPALEARQGMTYYSLAYSIYRLCVPQLGFFTGGILLCARASVWLPVRVAGKGRRWLLAAGILSALPPLVLAVTALFAQNAGSILRPVIRLYYPAVVQPLGRFLIQQLAPFAAAVCGFLGWKR